MEKLLSKRTTNRIREDLSCINVIFSGMWRSQDPMVITDYYDTTVLEINDGKYRINFNRKLWSRLSHNQRLFVICHEYMHIIFGHCLVPAINDCWLNIAQDIEVNEYLMKNFHIFTLSENIPSDTPTISMTWREKAHKVDVDRDYVYYYNLIKKCLGRKSS